MNISNTVLFLSFLEILWNISQETKRPPVPPPPPPPLPPPPPTPFPIPPPAATASQPAGNRVVSPPPPKSEMHVGAEVEIHGKRRAFLAEDATWLQTETFCTQRAARLCRYEELCPDIITKLSQEVNYFLIVRGLHLPLRSQDKRERRAPDFGPAHNWMEISNCGMTLWPGDCLPFASFLSPPRTLFFAPAVSALTLLRPARARAETDTIAHRGLLACCVDPPAPPPQPSPADAELVPPSAPPEAAQPAPLQPDGPAGADTAGGPSEL